MLGRITVDDVIDIIREDAEHSMMSMAGLDDEADTFAPVVKSTKQRSVWLLVNLCTALFAVSVSSMFEDILGQLAILRCKSHRLPGISLFRVSWTLDARAGRRGRRNRGIFIDSCNSPDDSSSPQNA